MACPSDACHHVGLARRQCFEVFSDSRLKQVTSFLNRKVDMVDLFLARSMVVAGVTGEGIVNREMVSTLLVAQAEELALDVVPELITARRCRSPSSTTPSSLRRGYWCAVALRARIVYEAASVACTLSFVEMIRG